MAGTLIFDQREKLVDNALADGCDVILFIDSDMRFPSDTIDILLSREVPIIGVNAVTRRKPTLPTALNLHVEKDEEGKITSHAWHKVDSSDKEGIEPVTAVGGGVVMIRKEVFNAIKKPWFDVGWGSKGIIGEDVHFCIKALDNGFQTYVDHSLSKHIGHIGTYEYRWDDVEEGAVERHNNGE
jgi:GT2 family glycosyltransferase